MVYIAVKWIDGWFYGIAYTFNDITAEETRLYTSHAYSDKRDAQADVVAWHKQWLAQWRVK